MQHRMYIQPDLITSRYKHMPLGEQPMLPPDPMAVLNGIQYTTKNGLDYWTPEAVQAIQGVLPFMAAEAKINTANRVVLYLTPSIPGGNALTSVLDLHQQGFAIMLSKVSPSLPPVIVASKDPASVVATASSGKEHAIVEIPTAIEQAAWALMTRGNVGPCQYLCDDDKGPTKLPDGSCTCDRSQGSLATASTTNWGAYGIALLVGIGIPAAIMAATVKMTPNKRRRGRKMRRNDALHERIAEVLGWPVKDTYGFDLQSLRELVRHKSPKLAAEITERIQTGAYIVGSRHKPKYRRNGSVVEAIRAGDTVIIVDRFGARRSGRAVMRGPHGWVLNMGGKHGTPAVASEANIVDAKPKMRRNGPKASPPSIVAPGRIGDMILSRTDADRIALRPMPGSWDFEVKRFRDRDAMRKFMRDEQYREGRDMTGRFRAEWKAAIKDRVEHVGYPAFQTKA